MTRAQSETLGFILVFSMIVASTGVVYVAGFSSLDDARTAEDLNNMERAFDVLDENVRDISRRGAPSRATEIKLGRGGLSLGNSTTITVTATNTSNSSDNTTISVSPRPIVYQVDDTRIVYVSDAVLRGERTGAVMRSEPRWVVDQQRMVIPLTVTYPKGDKQAIGGDTTVQVMTRRTDRSIPLGGEFTTGSGASANVTVTVESDRAGAWERFLREQGFNADDDNPADGNVTYWIETEELYVQRTTVSVEFNR